LVLNGMPFRDAYKKIGQDIEQGKFSYSTQLNHTHEGSIGNLCNDKIKTNFDYILSKFNFGLVEKALKKLIG
jgi:argininosuccinate lyase